MGRGRAAAKGAPAAQVVAVEQQLPAFGAFRGGECVGRGRVLAGQRRHGNQRKKAKPRDREATHQVSPVRSTERRVGKECVSTCRSRLSQYHYTQQTEKNITISSSTVCNSSIIPPHTTQTHYIH